MSKQLEGAVGVVTGAGRGIGAAAASLLAANGAEVILVARTEGEIAAVAKGIESTGGSAHAMPGDLTRQDFVESLFSYIDAEFGQLDFLVNNAGIAPSGPVEKLDPEDFSRCLEVNVVASFRCTQQAVRLMRKYGTAGNIVNVGSVRSHWTEAGDAGAYNASKYALRAMTESVARQIHGDGSDIAIGMVCPGVVDTTLTNPTGEPRPGWLEAEHVAEAILHAVCAPKGVNYFDTTLFPTSQRPW